MAVRINLAAIFSTIALILTSSSGSLASLVTSVTSGVELDPMGNPIAGASTYFDPTGMVVDSIGNPIAGATVTLAISTGDEFGPFVPVPDGSTIMSPANRVNPDMTDASGQFGWDVIAGFYRVLAEKDGFTSAETMTFDIPPSATGVVIELQAIPEPSSFLFLGLVACGAMAYRSKKIVGFFKR